MSVLEVEINMLFSQRQSELVKEFSKFSDWEARYKHIIQLGRSLPVMDEDLKIEDIKVKGCQSQVWLHASLGEDRKIVFSADSDAMIVKGLVAILIRMYSGLSPREVIESQPDFLKEIGLQKHLSPSRANGLYAMINQIKYYATAFDLILAK